MAAPSEENTEREANAGHVGALLQASRQRLGEELSDVALMLRIRLPYLAAIEGGRYRELPGATYAVGFIRAYAEHLGLDSEEVVRRFKAETIDGGADQKLSFPTPVPETGIPGGAYVFIGLVVAVLAYGAWYVSTTEDGFFADLISPLDEQLNNLLSDDEPETPAKESDEQESSDASPAKVDDEPSEPATEPQSSVEPDAAASVAGTAPGAAEPEATDTTNTETPVAAAVVPQVQPSTNQDSPVSAPAETASNIREQTSPPVPDVAETTPAVAAKVAEVASVAASAKTLVTAATPTVVSNPEPAPQPAAPSEQTAANDVTPAPVAPVPTQSEVTAVLETAALEIVAEEPAQSPETDTNTANTNEIDSVDTAQFAEATEAAAPEPEEINSAATIQSETEPAPFISSTTGTESEIAAPEPPAVPSQSVSDSESETTEIASATSPTEAPAESSSRITINAKYNSWIQVRDDVANQMLVTRLLTAGDSFEVPDRPGLVLLTGNAGALEIIVDGTAVPSIGGNGVVRRGVALEVNRLKGGTAVTN